MTTSSTHTRRQGLRRLALPVAGGLLLGLALGAVAAWRNPQDPQLVTVLVWAAATGPVLAAALLLFVTDRVRTDAVSKAGAADVERAWAREASETAFLTVMAGSVLTEGLGRSLNLGWLAPIGIVHVLVLGVLSYGASYLWLRHRGA